MNTGKPRKLGKTISEIEENDPSSLTEPIEDNQLLLYLGLTNGANPLYIQHGSVQKTEYQQSIVPSVILMGIITSAISKYFPGPGPHVVSFSINFIEPAFHYETLTFQFEIIKVDRVRDAVTTSIGAENTSEGRVLNAVVMAQLPQIPKLEVATESEGELNE